MIKFLLQLSKPVRYWLNKVSYKRYADNNDILQLKGKYRGKPLLVVGNGPSLNKTPLSDFKGIPSIGMNKIDLIYPKTSWRPDLVVCVNNLVVRQHFESLANSEIPVYLSWKSRRFIAKKFRKNFNYFLTLNSSAFETDMANGLGSSATVTYSALQMAYYLEADPIILFGVDHSFAHSGKAREYAKAVGPDNNHFDPNYFKDGSWWGLPDLDESEKAYMRAKLAFEKEGRTVFDATVGGKLDIFPKIDVNKAKKLCGI